MSRPAAASASISDETGDSGAVTRALADRATALCFDDLSRDAVAIARQCIMDWFAVTLDGAEEPAVTLLADTLAIEGGARQASLVGRGGSVPVSHAALVNGTASHALDYDDVHLSVLGHPTVAVLPALLALAEAHGRNGRDLITAFVAGYETACRVGELVKPSHYKKGFHATATVGSFGAAAALCRLVGLDAETTATAFGIAGTLASGLKSQFGTMCKPLHAGHAAENGLRAMRLAAAGYSSRPDILECDQGFAAAMSDDFHPDKALAEPPGGFHIRANLFKYHASCYLTHAPIEATRALMREHALSPDVIGSISLRTAETARRVCNIEIPTTGLEAKFSLHFTVALAASGRDTAAFATFSDEATADEQLRALSARTEVLFEPDWEETRAEVSMTLTDGRTVRAEHDSGVPADDVAEQGRRIEAKFMALVVPVLGAEAASELARAISDVESAGTLDAVMKLARREA